MKLQYKVMLIMGLMWALVSLIFVVDSRLTLYQSYQQLETHIINTDVHSLEKGFSRSLKSLSLYTLAWAQWDDAYRFVDDQNQSFIDTNFVPGTFESSSINFFMFFDAAGKYFYGKSFDPNTKVMSNVSNQLIRYLENNRDFTVVSVPGKSNTGILNTPLGLIVMTAHPVLKGDGAGPARGSLLMGYYLNQSVFSSYNELVDGAVSFHKFPLSGSAAILQANQKLQKGLASYIDYSDKKNAKGYAYLNDFNGHPVGILEYVTNRYVYQQAEATIQHYLIFILSLGVVFVVLLWFLLKRLVLDRIISVGQQVVEINRQGDFARKIKVNGSDEIKKMVDYLNNMMDFIVVSQHKLEYMVHHDDLTGLPNRLDFQKKISREILKAKKSKSKLALVFLDLNQFKKINDELGHAVGDGVLRYVAKVLKHSLKENDSVSRLSGDEFIIAVIHFSNRKNVEELIFRINHQLQRPTTIDGQLIDLAISAGVSIYPDHGAELEELISHADKAMYAAKQDQNRVYYFYDELRETHEEETV